MNYKITYKMNLETKKFKKTIKIYFNKQKISKNC